MNMQIQILKGSRIFYNTEKERIQELINDKNKELNEIKKEIKKLEKMKEKLLDPITSIFIFKICTVESIINNNCYYEYYYDYIKSEFIKKEIREYMKLPKIIDIYYFNREFSTSKSKLENSLEEIKEIIDSFCDNIIEEYKPETGEELASILNNTINSEKFELHVLNYKSNKLTLKNKEE